MKKLVSSLFAVIVMLFGGIFLTACDAGVTITANFKQTEITLEIGERVDAFDLIEEELSAEEKELIDFGLKNSNMNKYTYLNY